MKRGPTRIILRDARLSERDREKFGRGEILIEEKSENSLNRITAEANPRPLERVVPGTEFDFSLIYKILDMGDEGAEELFVLAAQVGLPNVRVVIAPTDLRQAKAPPLPPGSPAWTPKLYADLATTMSEYKAPKPKSLLSYFSE